MISSGMNTETRFPISDLSDAVNHFAGKNLILFCKLDCSQGYQYVQIADDLVVQLLAFSFAFRTYAYKCLAQGLSKCVTCFCSFVGAYLNPCLAAELWMQDMDDIAVACTRVSELVISLSESFACTRKSGSNLLPAKCQFGVRKLNFLGL